MQPEWKDRVGHWISTLEKEFYEPLEGIALEAFCTYEQFSPEQAEQQRFAPMPIGTAWGHTWEYAWMRGNFELPKEAEGQRIVMDIRTGGESTLFVDGQAFGTRRAEWVKAPHHFLCDQVLTTCGRAGQTFHLLLEAYAGHDYPESPLGGCATGPVREGDYEPLSDDVMRRKMEQSTFGIWHEEAYQLWLDVSMLADILTKIEPNALRAADIEKGLQRFTLLVDFEQPRAQRLADYIRARAALAPLLEAHNGSTTPHFYAIGNAHIDICWLWPYRETERKVARTFAQQVRLMDMYPTYRFIQSQPQAYQICKTLYPKLYEKIKEKIKTGQWIADGSMWVEPDTNMTSGESLIRQVVHGKRFYQEEFGVDCQLLWLPDTFGYSAVLPQILKGCGVKYLTTQKIFWTYNGSDRFPYHYFTWQGMDGSEITSFLHMDYTSRTDAATVISRWNDRVQRHDLRAFLLPFGYGDGGGGPTRDHIENVLRERDVEGVPQVTFDGPQTFFEDCAKEGAPANRYVGELYFQCHRGTYTSQAAIKRGNRKSELLLREAELWSVMAQNNLQYPAEALDKAWKGVLFNQFHDILPGSSIARVYDEARALYDHILHDVAEVANRAQYALLQEERGRTVFNSLSWAREALVPTGSGYQCVTVPPCGYISVGDVASKPERPVTVTMDAEGAVLENACLRACLNCNGEIISLLDKRTGRQRIGAPANVLHMYKDVPRLFDAWDIDSMYEQSPVALEESGTLEIAEDAGWRAGIRVTRKISNSVWTQVISLDAQSARVDFITTVDWQEKHRLLKACFPTGIHAEEAINEIQFGYMKRPTHRSRPYDADRFEVCNHRYTALCDEGQGAAVLNDCKYGVSMRDDCIGLTLLRAATSPDLHADRGQHTFAYAYYVWNGTWLESDVVREGYAFNVPVTVLPGRGEEASLLRVNAKNIIVETVKAAEDGSGDIILRLYECKHAQTQATLSVQMSMRRAFETDMLEHVQTELSIENATLALDFHPFEIKTLRLVRA